MPAYAETLPMIRRYWSENFGREPNFRPILILPDIRGLIAAAVAGAGATVVPDYLCAPELASGRLALLDRSSRRRRQRHCIGLAKRTSASSKHRGARHAAAIALGVSGRSGDRPLLTHGTNARTIAG